MIKQVENSFPNKLKKHCVVVYQNGKLLEINQTDSAKRAYQIFRWYSRSETGLRVFWQYNL